MFNNLKNLTDCTFNKEKKTDCAGVSKLANWLVWCIIEKNVVCFTSNENLYFSPLAWTSSQDGHHRDYKTTMLVWPLQKMALTMETQTQTNICVNTLFIFLNQSPFIRTANKTMKF